MIGPIVWGGKAGMVLGQCLPKVEQIMRPLVPARGLEVSLVRYDSLCSIVLLPKLSRMQYALQLVPYELIVGPVLILEALDVIEYGFYLRKLFRRR